MRRTTLILGLFLVLVLLLTQFVSVGAQGGLIQLAMVLDGSGSIDPTEFGVMREGLAAAIEDDTCFPQDGTVELTVVQFSNSAQTEVAPTIITAANAASVAATVRGISGLGGGTGMEYGFNQATSEIVGSPNFAAAVKQIINVSTDGAPNSYTAAEAARDDAIGRGIDEIDAEGIGTGANLTWLADPIVYPQPGTIHGPGYDPWPPPDAGWVRYVQDFNEYAGTICEKFEVIVPPEPSPVVPEASSLILLASGAASMAGYVGLQLRARRRK